MVLIGAAVRTIAGRCMAIVRTLLALPLGSARCGVIYGGVRLSRLDSWEPILALQGSTVAGDR
jgi:hypothetical protein